MNKIYHKFLIVFTILIIFSCVYFYFSKSVRSEAALSSSLDPSLTNNSLVTSDQINNDIAFITTLTSLNGIKIDTTLFNDRAFQSLNNNIVQLESVTPGRPNPFAPINSLNDAFSYPIITNNPLEIKDKTAVLSGRTNTVNGVTDAYFEYGSTETLGIKTPKVTISLIGSFVFNITNLDSKTNYFYKACAKVGSSTICGDIVTFETN